MGYDLAVLGLSLSSSWGNGHATTYRALLRGAHRRGQRVLFLERDVPWYRGAHRDLPAPDFADLQFYDDLEDLKAKHAKDLREAGAVMLGSYLPDGQAVIDWALETARGPALFYDIDTPVTLAMLARGEEQHLARRQIPRFGAYLSFTGGPILKRLENEFGAQRARPLYCSVDADRYQPQRRRSRRWRLGYLGTYSDDRQPALDRLLAEPAKQRPGSAFAVAGSQYPDALSWPANVERIDHLSPARHADFYNDQDFTLNVTRADMIESGWAPSVRLFEAAACGAPVISDRWDGLREIFPAGTLLIADTGEDVLHYLDMSERERQQIGLSACQLVRERHTGAARAAELERYVEECRSGSGAAGEEAA